MVMNMVVRPAERQDIPALSEIWRVCFGDPEEYIRFFYQENFGRIMIPICTVEDKPVSMLHLFEASFADGCDRQPAKLVYAVGTHPEYRQKGYMKILMDSVMREARKEGYGLFLKPASAYLNRIYQTFGFTHDASFRLVTLLPGRRIPLETVPLRAEQYNMLRNAVFSSRPYAEWPDRHVDWCLRENSFCGGKTLAVTWDASTHFLMGVPLGDTLQIMETDLSLDQLQRASGSLCALFGTRLLKACLPDFSCREGEEVVSSVIFNLPQRNTYVNLIML